LRKNGLKIDLFREDEVSKYRAIIFSKLYDENNQKLAIQLKNNQAKIIFDLCDNHFYNPYNLPEYQKAKVNLIKMIELADWVVCSSFALKKTILMELNTCAEKIVVIEDPVVPCNILHDNLDIKIECNLLNDIHADAKPVRLLWFGAFGSPNAQSGMIDILKISDLLINFSKKYPIELIVCSNNENLFNEEIRPLPFKSYYIEWSEKNLDYLLSNVDAVVLPISKNPYTNCKTNNRLATALLYGVPVISDSIESYESFRPYAFIDDWELGLTMLIERRHEAKEMAIRGRNYALQNFSKEQIADQWASFLNKIYS
jgi:glycosyltransferase involved in cell wall biosynthesis